MATAGDAEGREIETAGCVDRVRARVNSCCTELSGPVPVDGATYAADGFPGRPSLLLAAQIAGRDPVASCSGDSHDPKRMPPLIDAHPSASNPIPMCGPGLIG